MQYRLSKRVSTHRIYQKMVLVPMENAGERCLLHLFHRNPTTNAMQAQLVCCFADTEKGYALGGGKAVAGKSFDGKLLSVVLAYHL